jgi:hypothetical protein
MRAVGIKPDEPAVQRLRAPQQGGLVPVILKPRLIVEQQRRGISRADHSIWQLARLE